MTFNTLSRIAPAFLAIALIACGGGDADNDAALTDTSAPAASTPATEPTTPDASTTGAVKACDLITEQEASEALGQPSKYRSKDDGTNCVIDPVEEGKPGLISVDFSVNDHNPVAWDMHKDGGVEVAGIGEKAMWNDGMGLIADKGGKTVMFVPSGASGIGGAQNKAKIEAFAKKVMEKL